VKLKTLLDEAQKHDAEILAVSPDTQEDLLRMMDKIAEEDSVRSDFPFLSDLGLRVINRYGLFNPAGAGGGKYQVPHPGTFVIDKEGIVRWSFVEVDYSIRPSNEQVLEALEALH
jgi:peroxiredoxin